MLRLAVSGAEGKMGQAIQSLAKRQIAAGAKLEVIVAFDRGVDVRAILQKAAVDVLIDFTRPEATMEYIAIAEGMMLPMVVGTTGFDDKQLAKLKSAAQKMPLLVAANMSLGMNLLIHYAGKFAKSLGDDFDIDIVETHHRHKVDHPSGSAKAIGDAIVSSKGLKAKGYPTTEDGVRQRDGYPRYQSIRSGGVVGDHQVNFGSEFESITLQHRALTREVFADGAIKAAAWLAAHRKNGMYNMFHVLGVDQNG